MTIHIKAISLLTSKFTLLAVVALALFLRVYNLNYNSPTLDESSYILIGKLGVFSANWFEYNPATWMGGAFFLYPSFSALASLFGGIVGARALSALVGTAAVPLIYLLVRNLRVFAEGHLNKLAGIISAFLFTISALPLILSRLATYDILSFTFFILGLVFLEEIFLSRRLQLAPFAAASFLLAFLTKYFAAAYFLLVVPAYFLIVWKNFNQKDRLIYLVYFLAPLLVGLELYFILNFENLVVFWQEQVAAKDKTSLILSIFLSNVSITFVLASAALIYLFIESRKKIILPLTIFFSPAIILLFHLSSGRAMALEKHAIFAVAAFLAIIGIASARILRDSLIIGICLTVALFILLGIDSYRRVLNFQASWPNSTQAMQFLKSRVTPSDRILAQEGSATVLLYDKIIPGQVNTLFSFDYKDLSGEEAYLEALRDRYFDYIQLDRFSENTKAEADKIRLSLDNNYRLIYHKDQFEIYQRTP